MKGYAHDLKTLDGRKLKKLETLNYEKDFKKRKNEYLSQFQQITTLLRLNFFVVDFTSTIFIDE